MANSQNVYGVLSNGVHADVSKTERGAKRYATLNGYNTVSIRFNCGYIASEIATKQGNREVFTNGNWMQLKTRTLYQPCVNTMLAEYYCL